MSIVRAARVLTCLAHLVLFTGHPQIGQAQEAGASVLEEVVVTARRREEYLQEIPDSVTVFGETAIERAGIRDITDVSALTPNLSSYHVFRPNWTHITIRGIASTTLGEPPVAFLVDGITVHNLEFINQGLIDIQQIEVIRGPQSALYGKNAIGGAVLVTTKSPGDETEFVVRGAYGEGDDKRLGASVSGPLGEKAEYRLSAYYRDFDGLIRDSFNGRESDYVEERVFQGMVGFEIGDLTYIDFRGRYSTGNYGLGWYANVDFDTISDDSISPTHNILPFNENTLSNFSAKLEHEWDVGTLSVIAAYTKSDNDNFLDGDFSALPPEPESFFFPAAQTDQVTDSATMLEARFTSISDGPFRWLVGAYFQDRERDTDFDFVDDSTGDEVRDRASLSDELVFEVVRDRQSSAAFAFFGQTNHDLTDVLELTLALRYNEEDRKGYDPRVPASFAERTFDAWQPKVSLAWQTNDSLLTYLTLGRGFRPGGFNEVHPTVSRTFEAETSDTVELGFKSTVIEGVFTLNGAFFLTQQDNAQYTRFNSETFSLEQLTIAEVDIKGLEVEGWWTPTESIAIQFGLGLVDNEIKDFDPDAFIAPPVGIVGNTMPRVADWNGTLTFTHTKSLSEEIDLVSRLSGSWLGERFFDLENTIVDSSATYLNISFGLEADQWTAQLRGTNLLDDLEPEDVILGITTPLVRLRNQPRQIIGEFTYRF